MKSLLRLLWRRVPALPAAVALAIALSLLASACADDVAAPEAPTPGTSTADPTAVPTPEPLSGDITVFAASSLIQAFEEIAVAFKAENEATRVNFNFAGSQDLRTQLELGAQADLFAAADTRQIDLAAESGVVVDDHEIFAHNRLVVIVPKANEAVITTLQDLAEPGIKVVLANVGVPVGAYSRQFLIKASDDPAFGPDYGANVLANVVSEESNVRQVAARIQLDEADAGIVFSSDVTTELAAAVTTIEIPDALNVLADYPIVLTTEAEDIDIAEAFIEFVLSDAGQAILVEHNFIGID